MANGFFFSSCGDNTGPISEIKIGFEQFFEGKFSGMKFCLRGKSFKSFSNEYVFV